jgi:hypothetical protein
MLYHRDAMFCHPELTGWDPSEDTCIYVRNVITVQCFVSQNLRKTMPARVIETMPQTIPEENSQMLILK